MGRTAVVIAIAAALGPVALCDTVAWKLTKVATLDGFAVPECVVVADDGSAFVSNIQSEPDHYWDDDANAFITLLAPDHTVSMLEWAWSRMISARPRLCLNAPKGMCILGGELYVADNTRVAVYDIAGRRQARVIETPGAQHLNDMCTDGKVAYVSDTAGGCVFRLDEAGPVKIKAPESVNGITFHAGHMYAVSWDLHEVYEMDSRGATDPVPFGVASHFTNLDGIEVLDDGTFTVSDFTGGKIAAISPDRKTVTALAGLDSPADIGLDRERGLLYVPQFMSDKVSIYEVKPR
jgi:hypothetical protein